MTTASSAFVHDLKTDPEVFAAVLDGSKTHEIRFNDRDFKIGDTLWLRETRYTGQEMRGSEPRPLEFTGREVTRVVSHVLDGYGLQPGWVILSFAAPVESREIVAWQYCLHDDVWCDAGGNPQAYAKVGFRVRGLYDGSQPAQEPFGYVGCNAASWMRQHGHAAIYPTQGDNPNYVPVYAAPHVLTGEGLKLAILHLFACNTGDYHPEQREIDAIESGLNDLLGITP